MTGEELAQWAESFEAFHARFAPLFHRRETREQAAKYLRGLLAPLERKNGWQLAEALGDATPDRTQRLLYRAGWDADAARDVLQQFVIETFGDPEGIGVVDETGFLKKGEASVGVQRQYSGTAGKVDNCQVATVLTYATRRGHVFLDRRLYLPESWAQDRDRRERAGVLPTVGFQTKPQQAAAMLAHAWAQGVPMRWVTGDEVYGDAPYLRAAIERAERRYVLAASSTTPVWPVPRAGMAPERVVEVAPLTTVAAVVAGWPAERWQRLTVAEGEKGPRSYDWACGRVIDRREGQPGRELWLLARRSLGDPRELAYYLAHAPEGTPLATLARVAATRYTVEQCIEEAKGEAGLDQYEVRRWHSWYRHITLALMAHTWLAAVRAEAAEQGGPTTS